MDCRKVGNILLLAHLQFFCLGKGLYVFVLPVVSSWSKKLKLSFRHVTVRIQMFLRIRMKIHLVAHAKNTLIILFWHFKCFSA